MNEYFTELKDVKNSNKQSLTNKPSYYTIIPAYIRYDSDLSSSAKLLFSEIMALSQQDGYSWASNSYFARIYGVSTRIVTEWIKQLTEKGYITSTLYLNKEKNCIEKRFLAVNIDYENTQNTSSKNESENMSNNNSIANNENINLKNNVANSNNNLKNKQVSSSIKNETINNDDNSNIDDEVFFCPTNEKNCNTPSEKNCTTPNENNFYPHSENNFTPPTEKNCVDNNIKYNNIKNNNTSNNNTRENNTTANAEFLSHLENFANKYNKNNSITSNDLKNIDTSIIDFDVIEKAIQESVYLQNVQDVRFIIANYNKVANNYYQTYTTPNTQSNVVPKNLITRHYTKEELDSAFSSLDQLW